MSPLLTDNQRHQIYVGIIIGAVIALQMPPTMQAVYCVFAVPAWWKAKGRPIF